MRRLGLAVLLLGYAGAFGVAAFGGGVPAFDDHPGQYFRLWHALERSLPSGAWTADWNPDWWGGYPELQFYPPGFVLAGAVIRLLLLWQPSVDVVYQLLCGLVFLLPAVATFALMARVVEDRWLALPPAFLALTLSAGLRGGVEEGLRWGTLTSRLSLGCLPLFVLSLRPWIEAGRFPVWAPVAAAAVVLAHPATVPAALTILGVATLLALALRPQRRTLGEALAVAGLALALTAFWTLPLFIRRAWLVPLAWGDFMLSAFFIEASKRPVLLLVALAAPLAWAPVALRRRPFDAVLATLPVALFAALVADVWLFARGWLSIEPARVIDSVVFAALWAAGLAAGTLATRLTPRRVEGAGRAVILLVVVVLAALLPEGTGAEPTLTLWPRANAWPRLTEISEVHNLPRLWIALRGAPDRVLFLTSSLRLDRDLAWYAPHSHVLSLAPLRAGREIIHATFTHPSPVAARFYTGRATPPSRIDTLVEQLDGKRLLGQPWERLSVETFEAFARRMRVATVVVPTTDVKRARFLGPAYEPARETAGFTVFERRDRLWPTVERITHRRYRVFISPAGGVWVPTGIPGYPLWQVKSRQGLLETRTDDWGLLEFRVPLDVFEAELVYSEGPLEWGSLAVTLLGGAAWLICFRRTRRGDSPRRPRSGAPALQRRGRT